MDDPTSIEPLLVRDETSMDVDLERERRLTLQNTLRSRHSLALSTLMSQRADLHGVHALADQIDESLRWSA